MSKPYNTPANVANPPAIIHVSNTTLLGSIPDNRASSSLSEKALIDFPVLEFYLERKNNREQRIIVVVIVIAWEVLRPKPSFKPVIALNSLTVNMNRTPSLKLWSLGPIMKRISPAVKNITPIEAIRKIIGFDFFFSIVGKHKFFYQYTI